MNISEKWRARLVGLVLFLVIYFVLPTQSARIGLMVVSLLVIVFATGFDVVAEIRTRKHAPKP